MECQLNVKGINMEYGSNDGVGKTVSRFILKHVGECWMRNRVLLSPRVFVHKLLINCKEKNNIMVNEPGRHHLN